MRGLLGNFCLMHFSVYPGRFSYTCKPAEFLPASNIFLVTSHLCYKLHYGKHTSLYQVKTDFQLFPTWSLVMTFLLMWRNNYDIKIFNIGMKLYVCVQLVIIKLV